jgi:hypothetical protein
MAPSLETVNGARECLRKTIKEKNCQVSPAECRGSVGAHRCCCDAVVMHIGQIGLMSHVRWCFVEGLADIAHRRRRPA